MGIDPDGDLWISAVKYRNKPTIALGLKFASSREADRYLELKLLERAGHISDVRLQPAFVLAPAARLGPSKRLKPALRYVADFSYSEKGSPETIVEDVKGVETAVFRIKRHLMMTVHGIDLRIVK